MTEEENKEFCNECGSVHEASEPCENQEIVITKQEQFEVEIDTSETADPEERLAESEEGFPKYEEPVVEKILEKLEEIDEVENARRLG